MNLLLKPTYASYVSMFISNKVLMESKKFKLKFNEDIVTRNLYSLTGFMYETGTRKQVLNIR